MIGSSDARRWLPEDGTGVSLDPVLFVRLAALGDADILNAGFLQALGDMDELLCHLNEIERD